MKGLKKSGITLVRIPVTWYSHVDAAFTIDSDWMDRVKEVVNYAIDEGLYVILNCHHDNRKEFYYPDAYHEGRSVEYSRRIWKQIALQFKNYNEKLVFEILNEPRLAGDPLEWGWNNSNPNYKKAAEVIFAMEEAALTEIRASGGNNKNRYVMITPYAASDKAALSPHFKLPEDSAEDKLIVSVHAYTPYVFAMQDPGDETFTENHKQEINTFMKNLNDTFVSKGRPVIIGEYGATNKNNLEERVKWFSHYCGKAASYGIPTVLWDNGLPEVPDSGSFSELYGYYNRTEQTWYFPELLAAILGAY